MFSEFVSGQTFRITTYDSDTTHIIISFFEEGVFQDDRNLTLLQKKLVQKVLRVALHFSLRFAVICHSSLAGAIVASMVVNVGNSINWKELCQGCRALQGPAGVGESLFSKTKRWLRPVLCQL